MYIKLYKKTGLMSIYKTKLFFSLIAFTAVFFSLWSPAGHFTSTPKYWWDEAFGIETAHTFLETGKLDITAQPHTTSGIAIALNANGFPLTIPLAGVFKIFGIGITQARVYMLIWLTIVIVAIFLFVKNFFGQDLALLATLLITTFAPFYANGRTATGDIPGFVFLLCGLWYIIEKNKYIQGGALLGLALVTKTSLYHMALPAIIFSLLILYKKKFFIPTLKASLGALLVGIVWLALLLPHPYNISGLTPLINFYRNPINKASLLEQLPASFLEIATSSSIVYFAALGGILIAAYRKKILTDKQKMIFIFIGNYTILQTVVFLRSPGWNRYLLAIEILILMVFPFALKTLFSHHKKTNILSSSLTSLIITIATLQSIQYLFFSNIFSRPNPMREANTINELLLREPESTIGFIDTPTVAALISGNRKYQILHIGGNTYAGKNPLDNAPELLPTYMYNIDTGHQETAKKYYQETLINNDLLLYKRK